MIDRAGRLDADLNLTTHVDYALISVCRVAVVVNHISAQPAEPDQIGIGGNIAPAFGVKNSNPIGSMNSQK